MAVYEWDVFTGPTGDEFWVCATIYDFSFLPLPSILHSQDALILQCERISALPLPDLFQSETSSDNSKDCIHGDESFLF